MTFDLNLFMKIGPVLSGLVVAFLFWVYRTKKKKTTNLEDFFVVGITASAFPTGVLLIAAAFDSTLLTRMSDAPIYIALAGCAVLYITIKTVREKGTS